MTTELTEKAPAKLAAQETFDAHLASWGNAPAWLLDLKQEAWQRFQSLPMPQRKDENWRFARVQNLTLDGYALPNSSGQPPAELPKLETIPQKGGHIVFADDQHVGGKALAPEIAEQGVIFCTLAEAVEKHPDLLREHLFERLPDIGSEKFQALHAALFTSGTFVYVPKNVEVKLPLVTQHWTVGADTSVFPHTLIVAEDNAKVSVVDLCNSANPNAANFVCASADVYGGQGANVDYTLLQNWSRDTQAFHLNSATAERDATVKTVTVNIGGKQVRNEQHGRIQGEAAHIDMDSLGVVDGDQELDQRTLQTHHAGKATSDLLYKNALMDKARTIFSGLIRVDEEAQETDAYQTNRNLLLSPDADANSLPGLEIQANDVKCSHGATTAELDETNLFYFLARGIPKAKAQELLVFGFFEEIISKIENEHLADHVRELVQNKFMH